MAWEAQKEHFSVNLGVEVELQQKPPEVIVLEMNTFIRACSCVERNHHDIKTPYHEIQCGHQKAALVMDEKTE